MSIHPMAPGESPTARPTLDSRSDTPQFGHRCDLFVQLHQIGCRKRLLAPAHFLAMLDSSLVLGSDSLQWSQQFEYRHGCFRFLHKAWQEALVAPTGYGSGRSRLYASCWSSVSSNNGPTTCLAASSLVLSVEPGTDRRQVRSNI
ncbi:hypothetical protein KFU94_37180 [Chloroflexi bacterium TSY]|nr:hypothetical protein [Chloroflexi bacterium TSY]